MKKRILHISQSNGGVARYLQTLLKYMDRDKYENILIYPTQYKGEKEEFDEIVDKVEFVNMYRKISFIKDIKAIILINKLIKQYQPDLIYLHSSKAGGLGRIANLLINRPIIYNPHGWSFNMNVSKKKLKFYIFIEKMLAKVTDKIIAISEKEKSVAIENKVADSDKIVTILNGIDVEEYDLKYSKTKNIRGIINIPEEKIVIGMVARISKGKGADVFVEVAKKLLDDNDNFFFIIVGDGEERENIEELISRYNIQEYFYITGWVKNVFDYINIFDISMLLTRWEGFGYALAEYMIARKPVIATNVGAVPELVRHKETGILVEVDNVDQIVDSVYTLLSDNGLRDKIVNNGEKMVRKYFDVKRVSKEHIQLIDNILADNEDHIVSKEIDNNCIKELQERIK